jgi:hypothetical protein
MRLHPWAGNEPMSLELDGKFLINLDDNGVNPEESAPKSSLIPNSNSPGASGPEPGTGGYPAASGPEVRKNARKSY